MVMFYLNAMDICTKDDNNKHNVNEYIDFDAACKGLRRLLSDLPKGERERQVEFVRGYFRRP